MVNGLTLEKVVKYCEHHKDDPPMPPDEDYLSAYDAHCVLPGHITATETAVMDFLSGVGTGKLCVYDPATRETKTLLQGIVVGSLEGQAQPTGEEGVAARCHTAAESVHYNDRRRLYNIRSL
jgi:hypothetical protein